jgi:hypothetical protein
MTLYQALRNKGYNNDEADELIDNMRDDVLNGADPEELLDEYGLEPDYVMDLL